jgi:hypothetical protein
MGNGLRPALTLTLSPRRGNSHWTLLIFRPHAWLDQSHEFE